MGGHTSGHPSHAFSPSADSSPLPELWPPRADAIRVPVPWLLASVSHHCHSPEHFFLIPSPSAAPGLSHPGRRGNCSPGVLQPLGPWCQASWAPLLLGHPVLPAVVTGGWLITACSVCRTSSPAWGAMSSVACADAWPWTSATAGGASRTWSCGAPRTVAARSVSRVGSPVCDSRSHATGGDGRGLVRGCRRGRSRGNCLPRLPKHVSPGPWQSGTENTPVARLTGGSRNLSCSWWR